MSRIFLSHSAKDNFEAIALRGWLASEGWNDVFLDLDPERGIAAGERWERALHQAASRCEAVIFLVSANWLASGWCIKEFSLARGLNKKLFATLIDPTKTIDSLPDELTGVWQIVNLVGGQDHRLFSAQLPGSHEEQHVAYSQSGLLRLKRGLEKAGLDPRFFTWPPENEPNRAPYRGLKPQEAEDAGIFFGRDAPIVEAIDKLRGLRAGEPPRLFVILGASGAGKSSFLRAGLLPRLTRDDAQFIPLAVVRPEGAALTGENGLVNALSGVFPSRVRADLRTAAQEGAAKLRPLLAKLVEASVARRVASDESERPPVIVVAIDQAEELFRADGRDESEALLALLADLAKGDDPPVIVIFSIRSDSYDALQNAKALESLRQVAFPLLPMPRGAYQEVIEGPARRVEEVGGKLKIEPALTQKLLVDIEAGAGDALPLLAFTLEQLYVDYRQTGALRLEDYENSGGLKGAIDAAVGRALKRADKDPSIPRDRAARLALLRRGLIPWLAGVDPDSKTPRRNIARSSKIPSESTPLIDLLVEERLLSRNTRATIDPASGKETRESTTEPTHEALLRQWSLLDGWLKEDFGLLTTLEGVKRAARDWDVNARGDSWLAHQGQRLGDAQALDARPDIAARLNGIDRAYLAACCAREVALRAEAEQRRREREEEQARRLADARKIARRTRIGLAVASLLTLAAGGFAYYAQTERNDAIAQKARADQKAVEAINERNAADASRNDALEQKTLADKQTEEAKKQTAVAEAQTVEANKQKTLAEEQKAAALNNETHALAALSRAAAREGRALDGVELGLAAWPRSSGVSQRPMLGDAIRFLSLSFSEHPPVAVLSHGSAVHGAVYSPDMKRILSWSQDKTLRLWDAATGAAIGEPLWHEGSVNGAVYSPDMKRILSWSDDKTLRLWDAATGTAIGEPLRHEDRVNGAVYSPDMKRILSWSDDKTLRLWDAATGTAIGEPLRHEDRVNGAVYSPDGKRILSWSWDGTLRLWDAATGATIGQPLRHEDKVWGAVYSPNGTRILSWSFDKTLRLWDAATGAAIGQPLRHEDGVQGAVYSPDGTRVLSWSYDRTLRLWDAATGAAIGEPLRHEAAVVGAVYSPDMKRILSWSWDGTLRLWDAATGEAIGEPLRHENWVNGAVYSSDSKRILSWSSDRTLRLWDAATGAAIGEPLRHEGSVNRAVYSPDGNPRILSWSNDGTLRLWDVATGAAIGEPLRHEDAVSGAVYSPDRMRILSWSYDKTLRLWDAATGAAIGEPLWHEGAVSGAVYSPDRTRILSWSQDKTLRLWDAATGTAIGEPLRHEGAVSGAVYSPDRTRILSWSQDKTLRLWDAATGAAIGEPLWHEGSVNGAVYSQDGKRILSWSDDKTLRLWDAATGTAIGEPLRHEGAVSGAVYSPDMKRILSWSQDKTLRLWDATTGATIGEPLRHEGAVSGAVYSPDRMRILSWSWDGTLRLWDAATGTAIGKPLRHEDSVDGAVVGAVYSRDGKRILSWSTAATLRLWDAATGAAIGEPLRHESAVEGAVYSPDGKRILSWSQDKTLRLWDVATGAAIGEPPRHEDSIDGAVYSPDGERILSWSLDGTLRLWDASWRGDDLFEIACNYAPMMGSKEERDRLSKRYGVKLEEPICQPGVKIPDPDWSRVEPTHAK